MPTPLEHEKTKFKAYRNILANKMQDLDDETLTDTVDGLTNLSEILAEIIRSRLYDLTLCDALRGRIREMQGRLARLTERADRKQRVVAATMDEVGLNKLVEPDFTLSLRSLPPRLMVTAEDSIPEKFWRPQPPKLERQVLLTALKAGNCIPGAVLDNGGVTISVRTK